MCPAKRASDILAAGLDQGTPATSVDVAVPSWRPDIDGKADLVEEVMRIRGVDNIAPAPLAMPRSVNGKS